MGRLAAWMADEGREIDPPLFGTARATVRQQPKGVVGNIVPWNFPFDFSVGPLVETLAAGNRVIIKSSDYAPACAERWSSERARAYVVEVGLEAHAAFDTKNLWPTHPDDIDPDNAAERAMPFVNLYEGAAGAVVALAACARITGHSDLALFAKRAYVVAEQSEPLRDINSASYIIGTAGVALVAGLFGEDEEALDALYTAAETTIGEPGGEVFIGAPGFLIAARFAYEHTQDPRWQRLAGRIVRPLLGERHDFAPGVRLWVPHLYGRVWAAYLGAARGYAGIAYSILSSRELLDEIDLSDFETDAARTMCATAPHDGDDVNWTRIYNGVEPLSADPASRASFSNRLQWCNGAAGIVSALNIIPRGVDRELDALLVAAGETTWKAGPPRGDASFCDGAAGNGWAFLKLYRRTGAALWLDRARSYACARGRRSGATGRSIGAGSM